jgi:hypothetical protein
VSPSGINARLFADLFVYELHVRRLQPSAAPVGLGLERHPLTISQAVDSAPLQFLKVYEHIIAAPSRMMGPKPRL